MVKNFITALQFLTIFTVSKKHTTEEGDLAKSMVYFPVIGFLIGLILVYADKFFTVAALPQTIGNLLLLALVALATRALHIDGLADTCDGIMGGKDHGSRLSIMKDSRLGTAGALSIMFVMFLKYLCLNNLYNSEKVAALLTAPMLGRWSQTLMVFKANYGREDGMGRVFVGHLRSSGLIAASVIAAGLTSFVIIREYGETLDPRSVFLVLSLISGVPVLTYVGKRYLVRKLGGVTGDAIGAMSELNEVLVFLLFVILSFGS
ncbi:MAG: adenosylcobinamide-GDP ribazoletransferase [Betaproteobacteria bacterium]